MSQNENSNCYYIFFKLNGNFFGNMCVNESMLFCEVVINFTKYAQLKPENEATFSFNSNPIKSDSSRTLKDLEIKQNSIIEVTAKNIPNNNAQNNQANNNFPMGNQMNPGMGGMWPGMGGMWPGMGGMWPGMGGMNPGMGGMNPGMGGMNPGMGGMNPGMGGMNPGMGGMNPGMGGMNPGMGGMNPAMGGMNPGMGGQNPGMGGTAGKIENIGDDINWNIIFQGNGKIINVQATKDLKFSDLATRFKNKAATDEVPTFFLNSAKIEENDERTLSQIGLHNQSKIVFVFTNSVIGAYY